MAEPVFLKRPRPSASVILVRDGPAGGLETFMVRRHARSPVAPSAYVFPGGTVRADDAEAAPADHSALAAALNDRSDTPVDGALAAALFVSAVRELFEEAGVLLVRAGHSPTPPSGRGRRAASGDEGDSSLHEVLAVDASDVALQERLESTRLALQARDLSLSAVLAEWGWQAAFDLLVPFSHWVTPAVLAARFDTRFFVAEMPPRQAALHDTIETSEGIWLSPSVVLEGEYHTVFATAQHLRRVAPFTSVAELMAFARTKPIRKIQPEVIESTAGLSVHIAPELLDSW